MMYDAEVGRMYLALSNAAREIVVLAGKDPAQQYVDYPDRERGEVITVSTGREFAFNLKRQPKKSDSLFFQRFEHEPWFELGYFDETCDVWSDEPFPAGTRAHIETQARTDTEPCTVSTNTANNDKGADMLTGQDPDNIEATAVRLMAEANAIREFDAREPDGEEPTISWTSSPDGERQYTYVAFKTGAGLWYTTDTRSGGGMTWRELGSKRIAEALRTGTFLVATAWEER